MKLSEKGPESRILQNIVQCSLFFFLAMSTHEPRIMLIYSVPCDFFLTWSCMIRSDRVIIRGPCVSRKSWKVTFCEHCKNNSMKKGIGCAVSQSKMENDMRKSLVMVWSWDSCIQLALQFSTITEVIGYMNFKSQGDCQYGKDEPIEQTTHRIKKLILVGNSSG